MYLCDGKQLMKPVSITLALEINIWIDNWIRYSVDVRIYTLVSSYS